jgi:Outer membrane protein beta-barrel domain
MLFKRVALFVFLYFGLGASLSAQIKIGIEFLQGLNFIESRLLNQSYTELRSSYGWGFEGNFFLPIGKKSSVKIGLGLLEKNYEIARNQQFEGVKKIFTNTYFQIPVEWNFEFVETGNTSFGVLCGAYAGFWTNSRISGVLPNAFLLFGDTTARLSQTLGLSAFDEDYIFDENRDNRLELGLITGLYSSTKLNSFFSVRIAVSYQLAITDMQKQYQYDLEEKMNRTILVSLGLNYSIPKTQ